MILCDIESQFHPCCNEFFFSSRSLDGEQNCVIFMVLIPDLPQFIIGFLIFLGQLKIGFEVSVRENDRHELILINISNFQFFLGHVGDVGCGGSGGSVLIFLLGEDVNSNDSGLGRSMLSWLGSGVFCHLAGESLKHAVASLLDITEGGGSAVSCSGVSLLKSVLVVRHLLIQNYYVGKKNNSFIKAHISLIKILMMTSSLFSNLLALWLVSILHQEEIQRRKFPNQLQAKLSQHNGNESFSLCLLRFYIGHPFIEFLSISYINLNPEQMMILRIYLLERVV